MQTYYYAAGYLIYSLTGPSSELPPLAPWHNLTWRQAKDLNYCRSFHQSFQILMSVRQCTGTQHCYTPKINKEEFRYFQSPSPTKGIGCGKSGRGHSHRYVTAGYSRLVLSDPRPPPLLATVQNITGPHSSTYTPWPSKSVGTTLSDSFEIILTNM